MSSFLLVLSIRSLTSSVVIYEFFQTASGVTSSYDALLDLFDSLGNFLKRLEVYTTIPPTPMMMDLIVKIIVELLSVLASATKQIKQGRFSECADHLYVYYA